MSDQSNNPLGPREPEWRILMVFMLMTIGLYLVAGPLINLSEWEVRPEANHGLTEALAWQAGRLDIPATGPDPALGLNRPRDTAYRNGKVYNIFPPLFSFLSYAALKLEALQGLTDADAKTFYAPWYVGVVALPLPLVGFWAFRRVTARSEWAALMTAYWLLGTPLFKMVATCQAAGINQINHVLSNTGLLLVAGDLLGRRRIWPAALGLIIGAWTRQLTLVYFLAAAYIVWRLGGTAEGQPAPRAEDTSGQRADVPSSPVPSTASAPAGRCRGLLMLGVAAIIAVGALGVLNYLKFGNPLDTGYMSIYEGRGDMYAERAHEYGLFSTHFIPENAYYMNIGPPEIRVARMQLLIGGDEGGFGTSLWLTSPLLLFALWDIRRWWRDPARRALMLCTGVVVFGLLCYHNTGSSQHGLWRFGLDFVPIWLMVIAPHLFEGRRRWITLGCLAYSALYFSILCGTTAFQKPNLTPGQGIGW